MRFHARIENTQGADEPSNITLKSKTWRINKRHDTKADASESDKRRETNRMTKDNNKAHMHAYKGI